MPISINDSSYSAIDRQIQKNKSNFVNGLWVCRNNHYCPPLEMSNINSPHYVEYVASSTLLHLCDGWKYLEQALVAMANNSVGVCGHLSYYAELRAAMSFLAVNGLVTCNGNNYVITHQGAPRKLPLTKKTHPAIWQLLADFANPRKNNGVDKIDIGSIIYLDRIPLSDWIDAFCGSQHTYNVFPKYLKAWGIDLKKYNSDRNQRNKYSYAPCDLIKSHFLSVGEIKDFLNFFWENVDPSLGNGSLNKFDEYILWLMLNEWKQILGLGKADFEKKIDFMLSYLSLSEIKRRYYKDFLIQEKNQLPQFIIRGIEPSTNQSQDLHIDMFVRAFFLLRLATAAVRILLQRNKILRSDLSFWWSQLGKQNGLWDIACVPTDFLDLRANIDDALLDINTFDTEDNYSFLQKEAAALQTLSKTQYILLWGLAL